MSKLSLEALKERASKIANEELLAKINGGLENACHDKVTYPVPPPYKPPFPQCDNI